MNPRVKKVIAKDNYLLELTFDNNEIKIYDCSFLLNFGVFRELKDKKYFKKVHTWNGTIVWPNNQDICPDTLYLDSNRSR